jgi:hypothetical protein
MTIQRKKAILAAVGMFVFEWYSYRHKYDEIFF